MMREKTKQYWVWIDHQHHILSFKPQSGFEAVSFPSADAQMQYAKIISRSGYRIQ